MRLAIVASHQIQYYAPLYRALAEKLDLTVYFGHVATGRDQARSGFGVDFAWDSDLSSGHDHVFLENVSHNPNLEDFHGVDTPGIARELRSRPADAVLVMGWHLKTYWQTVWAAKRLGIPVMVRSDSHLHTPRNRLKRALKAAIYPPLLRVFDAALYVGVRSREYFRRYRYPENQLFFTPHCVDNDWFARRATPEAGSALRSEHGIAPEATILLFAGKLIPQKRPLDFVHAAKLVDEKMHAVTIMIAGDGPLAGEVNTAAQAANVHLVPLGFCNQSQMPAVYAAADALVLPSSSETWGLVANEALACGVPIVISENCGCAPDLAGDGSAGRITSIGNPASLANAIIDLFAVPPTAEAIARKAAQFSLSNAASGVGEALSFVSSRA